MFLSACASAPTMEEYGSADFGIFVEPEECINLGKKFITSKMKDPDSVRFSSMECEQGWESSVPIAGVPVTFGWRFVGKINAKNSYGGYTGFSPFRGIIRDDGTGPRVVRYCIVSNTDKYGVCYPQIVN
jgi:hypothetical protein